MPDPTSPRACLLVIDDEPMMLRAIQRWLAADYDTVAMTDPREALGRIQEGARFDAILCDLMMPVMSGMEVYQSIRALDVEQARRIVFMTGGAFAPRVLEFLASVPNARIEKPLERASLREAIRVLSAPRPAVTSS
jgi:CheY-like chemotaxis protein